MEVNIDVMISPCAGLFLGHTKNNWLRPPFIRCHFPIICDENIYKSIKGQSKAIIYIYYPHDSCIQVQYLSIHQYTTVHSLQSATEFHFTEIGMVISCIYENDQMANNATLFHTSKSFISMNQHYTRHIEELNVRHSEYTGYEDHIIGGNISLEWYSPFSSFSQLQILKVQSFLIRSHHISCIQNCTSLYKIMHTELSMCNLCKDTLLHNMTGKYFIAQGKTYCILYFGNKCSTESSVNVSMLQMKHNTRCDVMVK